MPWSKKKKNIGALKEKEKKKHMSSNQDAIQLQEVQEGSGESNILPGGAVVHPGAGSKKKMLLMSLQIRGLGEDDALAQPLYV